MTAAPRRDPKSGTWWFIVDLPAGGDGKRRQAKRRGFRTKADAQAALDELRVGVRKGTYVAPVRQTFGAFLTDDWLPAIRATVEPSTHESYSRYLRLHVIPHIGGVGLQQLDAGLLNRLYADLLDHGRRNGKPGGLSARTVRYIHTIIGRALREAVAWDRIARNVAQAAQPPGAAQAKSPEMKTWDAPTLAQFLTLVRNDRHQPAWLFLATTGCRRGEALGLRWTDVDLDTGKVVLYQTVSAINHELRIAPRTKSGKPRPIEIDAATVTALRAVRKRQAQERLLLGPDYADHDLVFARADGRPQHPEHFSNAFERRVARHRLPRIRLHDLRHTWATLALQAGVDVKIVSERLGHASAKITWDIYQHVTPTMQADAAETVARLIFGTPGQPG
jgi:integrase